MNKLEKSLAKKGVRALLEVLENPADYPVLWRWAIRFTTRNALRLSNQELSSEGVGDAVEDCYQEEEREKAEPIKVVPVFDRGVHVEDRAVEAPPAEKPAHGLAMCDTLAGVYRCHCKHAAGNKRLWEKHLADVESGEWEGPR